MDHIGTKQTSLAPAKFASEDIQRGNSVDRMALVYYIKTFAAFRGLCPQAILYKKHNYKLNELGRYPRCQ